MTTENTTPEQQIEPVKLTINDLQNLATIIKVAQKRGAFEVEEMSQVGAVFDKLNAFLKGAAEAEATAKTKETTEAEQA